MRSSPARLYRLITRVRAVTLAEKGATFIDVFDYLRNMNFSAEDSYGIAVRIFRAARPRAAPLPRTWPICAGSCKPIISFASP